MKKQDLVSKQFTEEGKKIFTNRMKSLSELFNKNQFPINPYFLGIGESEIGSKEECESRIKELGDILGIGYKKETSETKMSDGTTKKQEVIKLQF